ncbi:ATP-dependent DNA helicase pfh1-like [Drosophila rhopaloa]|uniref:ATP-dependent DNA helicase n=1 Tax=Drosophila rhopaloa TaxID=1041015 RepID=A0ABM5J8Q1_DRORH|nr:ATP-dependent DNA helicase pfh1-like [Drosophila rhopaloa]
MVRRKTDNFTITEEMRNEALIQIEDICMLMCGSLLATLGMPALSSSMHDAFNREFQREHHFDQPNLAERVRPNVPLLNAEQKNVYDSIMKVVCDETGGLYFLDAPGGTGKTFVISLILATIRSRSQIAVAVASSGIAATLLEGGRTAHSALKLPMNLLTVDQPTCTMNKNSATAKLMRECKIIIWDECTMAHKRALEAVDQTIKDLRGDSKLFGGALILLSGDFRQTLPVIPKSTAADEVIACLKSSSLWRYVKKFKLSTNMRVALQNDPSAAEFSRQLLALGNGEIPVDVSTGLISFPANFCEFTSSKEELITKVFPDIAQNYKNLDWISERAILAAKNNDVDSLNFVIQSQIAGELHSYKSVDSVAY